MHSVELECNKQAEHGLGRSAGPVARSKEPEQKTSRQLKENEIHHHYQHTADHPVFSHRVTRQVAEAHDVEEEDS